MSDCPIGGSGPRRDETRRDATRRRAPRRDARDDEGEPAEARERKRSRGGERDAAAASTTARSRAAVDAERYRGAEQGWKTPRPRSMGSEDARFKKAPFRAVGTVSNEFLHTSFHETRTHGVQANWSLVRTLVCATRRRRRFASNVCGARARVTDDYARRRGRDRAEQEFFVRGPIVAAQRPWREDHEEILSGAQIVRRTLSELLGFPMDERDRALDAPSREPSTEAPETDSAVPTSLPAPKSMSELFEAMKTIVAPDLHEKLAHLLIESRCVTKSGREDERAVAEIAASFQLRVAQSRRSAVALQ